MTIEKDGVVVSTFRLPGRRVLRLPDGGGERRLRDCSRPSKFRELRPTQPQSEREQRLEEFVAQECLAAAFLQRSSTDLTGLTLRARQAEGTSRSPLDA